MNKKIDFYYSKKVTWSFEHLINKVTYALVEEWFTLLSKINLQERIKENLWKDIEEYIILWACNTELSYEIVVHEIDMWLFLPCNIIIYKKFWETHISIIKPSIFNHYLDNNNIQEITNLADKKLKRVLDNV